MTIRGFEAVVTDDEILSESFDDELTRAETAEQMNRLAAIFGAPPLLQENITASESPPESLDQ